jgi:hypothetical protein
MLMDVLTVDSTYVQEEPKESEGFAFGQMFLDYRDTPSAL